MDVVRKVTLLTYFMVLLTIVTNLEAALLGDHICQKEIIVAKEVPKWELKKQTTRTYQWCMSVPPRCSVYSTKLVNESRNSVINVTTSVETCCEGFKEQNNVCISMCQNCQHGLCYKGECICRNGWDGPECDNRLASTTSQPTTASALPTSHDQSELTFLTQIAFTTASSSFARKEFEFEAKETAEDIFAPLATSVEDLSLKPFSSGIETSASAELEGSGFMHIFTLHAEATESVPKYSSTFFLESDPVNLEEDSSVGGDIFQEEPQPSTPSPVSVPVKPITKGHEEENAILKDWEELMGGRYEKRASVETLTQNTKLSVNEASSTHLIYSICAASLVSFLLLVTAISIYAVRSSRKKIENAKRTNQEVATVAVYTSSIFHSPLPDPPVFDNPTYLVAGVRIPPITQAEIGLEVQEFNVAYPKQTKPSKLDCGQYFYDHPPSTGSYRASSEVDTLSQYNVSQKYVPASSLEPVYDEIPAKMDVLEPVSVDKGSSSSTDPHCLYMNTCGRTKL